MQVVQLAHSTPQPWKNGGGTTRDLLAWPGAPGWQLRISVADVAQSGPFSAYPGVERWFAVVQGDGVELHFGAGTHRLTAGCEPLQFDGAAAPGCTLLGGPTLDLNLLAHAHAGRARMQLAQPGVAWVEDARLRAVFVTHAAQLQVGTKPAITLPAMSLAYDLAAGHEPWRLTHGGSAWWLSFHVHTAQP